MMEIGLIYYNSEEHQDKQLGMSKLHKKSWTLISYSVTVLAISIFQLSSNLTNNFLCKIKLMPLWFSNYKENDKSYYNSAFH